MLMLDFIVVFHGKVTPIQRQIDLIQIGLIVLEELGLVLWDRSNDLW